MPRLVFFEEQKKFEQEQARLAAERATSTGYPKSGDPGYDEDFDDFEDDLVDEPDDDFSDFEGDISGSASDRPAKGNLAFSSYWFNQAGLEKVRAIQASLEALPETGKVLSLATSISIFDNLKDAEPMDNIDLGFMYNVLSDENINTLFVPYMSADANQIHISIRGV